MKTWTKGIVTGLLAGVVSLGSLPAMAGPYDSNINQQEWAQEQRIQRGLYSGQLTPGEFRRLENQQARIRATEAQMRADGRLTRGEKTQLAQMQERANWNIYRYKHNNFRQGYYGPANYRPVHYRPGNWRGGWR